MIRVNFKLERRKNNKFLKREYVEYYAVGEEKNVKFIENIERAVTLKGGVDSKGAFHSAVVDSTNWFFKRKFENKMNIESTCKPIRLAAEI